MLELKTLAFPDEQRPAPATAGGGGDGRLSDSEDDSADTPDLGGVDSADTPDLAAADNATMCVEEIPEKGQRLNSAWWTQLERFIRL